MNLNSLSTLASLFLIQARRFIKFVKQVFQQQQTSSSELWNRWHLIDRSTVSERRGWRWKRMKWKSYQMSPRREYPSTSVPLFSLSYPQGKAIYPCTLLLTRHHCAKKTKNTARLFVCGGTVVWPWMLFSVWQSARKQSRHSNTENVSLGKKKID